MEQPPSTGPVNPHSPLFLKMNGKVCETLVNVTLVHVILKSSCLLINITEYKYY